jgi:hypothetical protein
MADLLYVTFYKLIKFMLADFGSAIKPFLHKLANRYAASQEILLHIMFPPAKRIILVCQA